jgi:hypothetical protein
MNFGGDGGQNFPQQKGRDRRVKRIPRKVPNSGSEGEGTAKHRNKSWRREDVMSSQSDSPNIQREIDQGKHNADQRFPGNRFLEVRSRY